MAPGFKFVGRQIPLMEFRGLGPKAVTSKAGGSSTFLSNGKVLNIHRAKLG